MSVGARRIEAAAPTAARSGFRGFVGEKKAGNGVGVSQPLRLLVDSRVHAEELARFEALVVRGPGADDCAIWKGAIGGDGYGRYWVRRGCSERIMVRANRYALAAAQDGVSRWNRRCARCTAVTTRSLGGSSVLRRLRAVAHDAGDRNEQSGTMLSPNNGEITPTGN